MSTTGNKKIRVLIIDDSALMRQMLSAMLSSAHDIDVIGTAADPYIARNKIKALNPDVITLDVEMPGMDGLTFLEKLMRLRPMPVVMVSSLTEKGATTTLRALELGAVEFVAKPKTDLRQRINEISHELQEKIRLAASAQIQLPVSPHHPPHRLSSRAANSPISLSEYVIVVGASAGGTQAIKYLLEELPNDVPGIAVVQHMPPKFTAQFARRLNDQCSLAVKEAQHGDKLEPGTVFIAPGDAHMALMRHANGFAIKLMDGQPVNLHIPSVDVLFESAAKIAGSQAMGILLTGMGKDGAQGMLQLKQAGAYTIAQDEQSCMVFGMPDQAIRLGAVREVMPLERIPMRMAAFPAHDRAVELPIAPVIER